MHSLIFDCHDISLEYENNCLIVRQTDLLPRSIPLSSVRKIICLHSVKLTTSVLGQLWERGIDFITLNSRYSERCFSILPNQSKRVERRCIQYQWQQDEVACLAIAISICQHRFRCNQRILKNTDHPLHLYLQESHHKAQFCNSLSSLRGVEGQAQKQVLQYWREQLAPELGFEKRQARPATDPVNALLSLTYMLVMHEAIRQCTRHALDSQLGFYHRVVHGRHSLACDLMEPVRAYCEQWVFESFINGTFNLRHFTQPKASDQSIYLGKEGRKIFYNEVAPSLVFWQKQLQAHALWLSRKIDESLTGGQDATPPLAPNSI